MRAALIAASLLLTLAAPPLMAADKDPAGLTAEIDRQGPAKVVAALASGTAEKWQHVLDEVASGNDAWLKLAIRLRPGTDAGTGEALSAAVASALKTNPDAVLGMVGPEFPIEQVCTVPLIEPSADQVEAWKSAALAALAKAKGDAKRIGECRDSLAAIQAE